MKAFGGTYEQYLDTSEEAIETLLHIEGAYAEAASRAPVGRSDPGPSQPQIS